MAPKKKAGQADRGRGVEDEVEEPLQAVVCKGAAPGLVQTLTATDPRRLIRNPLQPFYSRAPSRMYTTCVIQEECILRTAVSASSGQHATDRIHI